MQGIVISLSETSPVAETKPIEMLVDPQPVLTSTQLHLAHWMASETLTPLGECLHLMLPAGLSQQADSEYVLIQPDAEEINGLMLAVQEEVLAGKSMDEATAGMAYTFVLAHLEG